MTMASRIVPLLFLITPALSVGLFAQDATKLELFGGYSYMRTSENFRAPGVDQGNANGWQVAFKVNLLSRLGLVLDGTGHYGSVPTTQEIRVYGGPDSEPPASSMLLLEHQTVPFQQHTFLFGPEVRVFGSRRFIVDLRGLVGIAHSGAMSLSSYFRLTPQQMYTTLESPSQAKFAASIGGSVGVPISKRIALRLIQAEVLFVRFGGGYTQPDVMLPPIPNQTGYGRELGLSTGAVFGFGWR
jgi:hypothetical protein